MRDDRKKTHRWSTCRAIFSFCRVEDGDVDEKSNDDDDDDDYEEGGWLSLFVTKSKGKKKKSGRKSAWSPDDVDDVIDIVVSN